MSACVAIVALFTSCALATTYDLANFQAGSVTLDGGVYNQVGGWDFGDKIYVLGGEGSFNTRVFEFDIPSAQFTEISPLSNYVQYSGSRASTQINNLIYMFRKESAAFYIATYDVETKIFNPDISRFTDYSTDTPQSGCMSNIKDEYIIITGGNEAAHANLFISNMRIFELASLTWSEGPQLINSRHMHGCEVVNNRAYVIGGYNAGSSIEYIDVSNMNNINDNSWTLFGDTITSRSQMSTVVYNQFIYVIGGSMDVANGIEVIDTLTNTVVATISTQVIATTGNIYQSGAVVATLDTIYIFGGCCSVNTYQYTAFQSPLSKAPYDLDFTTSTTPTAVPTSNPTESPTFKVCTPEDLDWDSLINTGSAIALPSPISITSSWDQETLQLDIEIRLDYVTRSKYTFIDEYDSDRGVTYVIDTEPFLSDGRLLEDANNCENRDAVSFNGKDWNTEYWSYLNRGNGLNSGDYLEYGPSSVWTLNWETECETIKYSKSFAFSELLACANKNNEKTFTFVDEQDSLALTGEFYVTIVSPLINQNNVAQTEDFGQYLTNTVANYPVSIQFPKKIASVRDPGVILFDISIFAIQYDEASSKLLVDILSYAAKYINLQNVAVNFPTVGYDDPNNAVNSITINEDDSYLGARECLFETIFRCFQKFQIEIGLSSCPAISIDLSTLIILDTEPTCRTGEDCTLFHEEFGPSGTIQKLNDNFGYIESCDAEVYIQTFEGVIKYYRDVNFLQEVDETAEFSIGSTIYVDVSVNDIGAYDVFGIDILNVWICTTSGSENLAITSQLTGVGGCIEDYASNNAQGSNVDEIYQPFKDGAKYNEDLNGQIYTPSNDESVRFSLIIPSFQRNKFWLHAIVELKLKNNIRRRARLLLAVPDTNTVNRLSHYIKDVTIVNDIIKTTFKSVDTTKKEANSTVSYYSFLYIIYAICFFICLSV